MISSDGDEKTLRLPLCFARPLSRLGRAQTRLVLLIPAIAPARTCSLARARTRSLSLNRCFISRLIRNSLKSRIYYSVSLNSSRVITLSCLESFIGCAQVLAAQFQLCHFRVTHIALYLNSVAKLQNFPQTYSFPIENVRPNKH